MPVRKKIGYSAVKKCDLRPRTVISIWISEANCVSLTWNIPFLKHNIIELPNFVSTMRCSSMLMHIQLWELLYVISAESWSPPALQTILILSKYIRPIEGVHTTELLFYSLVCAFASVVCQFSRRKQVRDMVCGLCASCRHTCRLQPLADFNPFMLRHYSSSQLCPYNTNPCPIFDPMTT